MRQLLLGCLCVGLVALSVGADDKEATAPKEMFQELVKKFRAAKGAEQKQILQTYAKKFVDYAKANVKDEEKAFEALGFIFQLPLEGGKDSPKTQAVEMLKKEFVKSKKIGDFLPRIAGRGDPDEDAISLIKAVMEENPDKSVKAKACMALAQSCEDSLGMAYWIKHDKSIRGQFEKMNGKEKVAKMVDGIAAQETELKSALEKLRGEYKSELKKDLYTGAQMPELTSEDLEGKKVKLSDLKGKVVVLDIWATWCPPCRAMIPHEREMVDKLKGKPFELVSISFDQKKETLKDFLEKEKMPWTHWWNGQGGMIGKELTINSFPTIFVLDHKGVIRYKGVRNAAMDWAVESLLKEMEEEKKAKTE